MPEESANGSMIERTDFSCRGWIRIGLPLMSKSCSETSNWRGRWVNAGAREFIAITKPQNSWMGSKRCFKNSLRRGENLKNRMLMFLPLAEARKSMPLTSWGAKMGTRWKVFLLKLERGSFRPRNKQSVLNVNS